MCHLVITEPRYHSETIEISLHLRNSSFQILDASCSNIFTLIVLSTYTERFLFVAFIMLGLMSLQYIVLYPELIASIRTVHSPQKGS